MGPWWCHIGWKESFIERWLENWLVIKASKWASIGKNTFIKEYLGEWSHSFWHFDQQYTSEWTSRRCFIKAINSLFIKIWRNQEGTLTEAQILRKNYWRSLETVFVNSNRTNKILIILLCSLPSWYELCLYNFDSLSFMLPF